MKNYLGVKLIKANELKLGDYNKYKGWKIPSDEDPNRDGYLVIYEDGYESWSPKEVFDKAYRRVDNLTLGLAVEALKKGESISRKGWNGKDMFITKQISVEVGLDVIPKMQSIQKSVKDKLIESKTSIKYGDQMLIIKPDGTADSWVPSSSDIFAEDWFIV